MIKKWNKFQALYRKNCKNGNKLDDTYKKLNSDNPPIEIFDKKRNKLIGLYRKVN